MSDNLKERAFKIVQQRNLCSLMNNTKWKELREAVMTEMPFCPPYIMKTLFENSCKEENDFQQDVWYHGDWDEGLSIGSYYHGYFAIEWIKVRPRYVKFRGRLIEPEMIDASEKFEEILNRFQIPFIITILTLLYALYLSTKNSINKFLHQ